MFYIDAPAKRDDSPSHCFEVTVPTYQSFEAKLGEQVATIHAGSAALTLWTVKGVKVSDTPTPEHGGARGVDDGYVYADGELGDRVTVHHPDHGECDILPYMLMSVYEPDEY